MTAPVIGVLLAGGQSRRMGGGDKCLIPLGGKPMIGRVIDRLAPQCESMVINANGPADRFAEFGLPVIADTIDGFVGPLAGVLTGLRWIETNRPEMRHIVTAATDTPFFPTDLVRGLVEAAGSDRTIVLAASQGKSHPVFGLWPIGLADDLEGWLAEPDNRKILRWVDRHPNRLAEFPLLEGGVDPFSNINTPEDLKAAEANAL